MKKIFLDIGDVKAVPLKDVVVILDADTATRQAATRLFLKKSSEKKNAVLPGKALSRVNSLVLTSAYGIDRLYSSAKTAKLLGARANDEKI